MAKEEKRIFQRALKTFAQEQFMDTFFFWGTRGCTESDKLKIWLWWLLSNTFSTTTRLVLKSEKKLIIPFSKTPRSYRNYWIGLSNLNNESENFMWADDSALEASDWSNWLWREFCVYLCVCVYRCMICTAFFDNSQNEWDNNIQSNT